LEKQRFNRGCPPGKDITPPETATVQKGKIHCFETPHNCERLKRRGVEKGGQSTGQNGRLIKRISRKKGNADLKTQKNEFASGKDIFGDWRGLRQEKRKPPSERQQKKSYISQESRNTKSNPKRLDRQGVNCKRPSHAVGKKQSAVF